MKPVLCFELAQPARKEDRLPQAVQGVDAIGNAAGSRFYFDQIPGSLAGMSQDGLSQGSIYKEGETRENRKRALVLWSGGLDSTTLLAVVRRQGFEPVALLFSYGQRHAVEVEQAEKEARNRSLDYRVVNLDLRSIGGSALTSDAIDVPQGRDLEEISTGSVPPTYVPARNTIFLSYALAWAEVLSLTDIFIGVNSLDYSGYPDCRPEYVAAFERLANLACRSSTEGGVQIKIHAPLIDKTKAEIIRWGIELGVDYAPTWSCYVPRWKGKSGPLACGVCDSCLLRRKGFLEAGVEDPTGYY